MHEREQQDRNDPHRFSKVVHDCVEHFPVALVFREHPGFCLIDILVRASDDYPEFLEGDIELEYFHRFIYLLHGACSNCLQIFVESGAFAAFRNDPAAVLLYHSDSTRNEISEIVRQVVVESLDHYFIREHAVLPERILTEKEILQRVYAVTVDEHYRVNDVAL